MDSQDATPNSDERILGLLAHLLGIFTGFLGPLVLWLVKREEGGFVEDQAREALNFQIFVLIGAVISAVLALILVGVFLAMLLGLYALVISIVAAVKAYDGKRYRYPLTLRLIS